MGPPGPPGFGWFLIHYGWRGTLADGFPRSVCSEFLIHYGWRGTSTSARTWRRRISVSNPLRLEGDTKPHSPPLPA